VYWLYRIQPFTFGFVKLVAAGLACFGVVQSGYSQLSMFEPLLRTVPPLGLGVLVYGLVLGLLGASEEEKLILRAVVRRAKQSFRVN
jgi:hypothetical protein